MFFFSNPTDQPNIRKRIPRQMKKKGETGLFESGGHPLFLTSLFGLFLNFFFLVRVVNSFVNSEICLRKILKTRGMFSKVSKVLCN